MSAPFHLFRLTLVESPVVIDGLPLDQANFLFQFLLFLFVLFALPFGLPQDAVGLLLISLHSQLVLQSVRGQLRVSHFELGYIIFGLILVVLQEQLHNGAVSKPDLLPFVHVSGALDWRERLTHDVFTSLSASQSGAVNDFPLVNVLRGLGNIDSREELRQKGDQFCSELIVEAGHFLRVGHAQGMVHCLRQDVEVVLEEEFVVVLVRDRQQEVDVVLGHPPLEDHL